MKALIATLQDSVIAPQSINITSDLPSTLQIIGREHDIQQAVDILTSGLSGHYAILGTGSTGKASVALNIVHDAKVQAYFDQNCYFVPCVSITSASMLVNSNIQVTGHTSKEDTIAQLKTILNGSQSVLLVLKNFESVYDAASDASNDLNPSKNEVDALLKNYF